MQAYRLPLTEAYEMSSSHEEELFKFTPAYLSTTTGQIVNRYMFIDTKRPTHIL